MAAVWTLGGLSPRELLRRTAAATWRDSVYGQAGKMAFYHFLAIFPSLLLFLALTGAFRSIGSGVKETARGLFWQVLPGASAGLIEKMVHQLQADAPVGIGFLSTCAGALWAALNGTWAIISGLNVAYEVKENRSWKRLGLAIVGLTLALAVVTGIALLVLFSATNLEGKIFHQPSLAALRAAQWVVVLALLSLAFAIIYRFGPNLKDAEWKWSTPGSVCAVVLWVGCTLALRIYFDDINNYRQMYGDLNTVAMLLLWLYLSNASILIGGEMNSEIEKAADNDRRTPR